MTDKRSGWTVDTLKEFVESKLAELRTEVQGNDRRYEERFEAQEAAVQKYATEAAAKGAIANEWRGAMQDRESKFATKDEENVRHESASSRSATIIARIEAIERFQLEKAGQGAGRNIGYISAIGIVSLIVTLITMAFMLRK